MSEIDHVSRSAVALRTFGARVKCVCHTIYSDTGKIYTVINIAKGHRFVSFIQQSEADEIYD